MQPGKFLIIAGLVLVSAGLFFSFGGKIPFWGRLPGDIAVKKNGFSFYFPLGSCILASLLLSLLLWLFRK